MKRNIEQVNGWYNQALELNEKLYAVLNEIFNGNEIVSYCVETDRWDTFVSLRVFAMIAVNGVAEELRELAGTFSAELTLQEYTQQETIDGFVDNVINDIKPFVLRAGCVENILNKNKKDND